MGALVLLAALGLCDGAFGQQVVTLEFSFSNPVGCNNRPNSLPASVEGSGRRIWASPRFAGPGSSLHLLARGLAVGSAQSAHVCYHDMGT